MTEVVTEMAYIAIAITIDSFIRYLAQIIWGWMGEFSLITSVSLFLLSSMKFREDIICQCSVLPVLCPCITLYCHVARENVVVCFVAFCSILQSVDISWRKCIEKKRNIGKT